MAQRGGARQGKLMSDRLMIETFSGVKFNLEDPSPDMVRIEDIAHATSNICRYTGHCRRFYSVAEHMVIGCGLVPEKFQLMYLLHDAAEAYFGDVSRPLKLLLDRYDTLEAYCAIIIYNKFLGRMINPQEQEIVKKADDQMLLLEAKNLMHSHGAGWKVRWTGHAGIPRKVKLKYWSPKIAEAKFLEKWKSLQEGSSEGNGT